MTTTEERTMLIDSMGFKMEIQTTGGNWSNNKSTKMLNSLKTCQHHSVLFAWSTLVQKTW